MAEMTVHFRSLPDTEAAVGWAGGHIIVVDRPQGRAGGRDLGFNGGELLGLAIGGCLCNDLRYVAADMGIRIAAIAVDVVVHFDGEPLLATDAAVTVAVTAEDAGADIDRLIERAKQTSTVSNSIGRGIPVAVSRAEPDKITAQVRSPADG
jgi:organic hydroperoxide reductase OsmC/OhrA